MPHKAEFMTARRVLWLLVFTGMAINYMIRININIAIVGMVRHPRKLGAHGSEECLVGTNTSVTTTVPVGSSPYPQSPGLELAASSPRSAQLFTPTVMPGSASPPPGHEDATSTPVTITISSEEDDTFTWDAKQQGLVLGAFFWLHWLTQLPGGMLAQRFGTKLVYGLSNAVPGIIGLLIPAASHWDYRALLAIRLLQGIIAGFCWPSMHNMAAQWIPPDERSNFVTAYLGSSVGAALTFPLCGLLIQWMGWPSVFYVCGGVTAVWAAAWYFFAFDSPAQHPRISPEERRAIEKAIGNTFSSNQRKLRTPWKALLTSGPVWVNVMAQWGGIWSLFTLLTQAPTYFNNVHHWDIRMAGLLSGIPHLFRIILGAIVSQLGDHFLRKGTISRTTLRKLATAVCDIGQGLFVLGLAWSGCDAVTGVICLTLATACSGGVSTGPLASIVDISPNFASIILGICAAITVLPGFISPYIVGLLTFGNQSTEQWKKVYIISGLMAIVAGLQYVIFADSTIQPWNNPMVSVEQQNELGEIKPQKDNMQEQEQEDPLRKGDK